MLHDFVSANRYELLSRTRAKVASRPWGSEFVHDLEGGISLFLTQLSETLRLENDGEPFPDGSIGSTAARHGGELLAEGVATSGQEVERLGQMAHELRNLLQTSILAFDVLKSGRVGIAGSTGAVLGRSLVALSERVDTTLSQVRLTARNLRRVQVSVLVFVDEVAVAAACTPSTGEWSSPSSP